MKHELFVSALSLLASCLASSLAFASTAAASFSVSVNAQASCQVSHTAITPGAYNAGTANESPAVSVNCTNPTPYSVALSPGRAARPNVTTPEITGPATDSLRYALFPSATPSPLWKRLVKMHAMPGTEIGLFETLSASGEIMGTEFVVPGAYANTIIVTITY